MASNNEQAMTPEEVAVFLNIAKTTVYEMVKRGEIKAYRIGRNIRIDKNELDNYKTKMQTLNSNEQKISEIKKDNSTFIICGQDLILDIICRYLESEIPSTTFLRSHMGSYNALFDLYNDKVNVATCHLWDGDTNSYNTNHVKYMLPGMEITLINLVKRQQGFYVLKNNPKNIKTWKDLKNRNVTIVNREKGSGVRVLLDEHLRLLKINPKEINGYNSIANSHLSIGSAVARSFADVGIGNEKVAQQISGIDFIPLQKETYDLVIKNEDLENPIIQSLITIVKSEKFRDEIRSLGGYEL